MLLFVAWSFVFGQKSDRDSLFQSSQDLSDSLRLTAYNEFAAGSNSIEDIQFWIDQLEKENTSSDSVFWNAIILHQYGNIAKYQGELQKVIDLIKRAIQKFNTLGEASRVGKQYNNIGNAFADMSNYDSAMHYYHLFLEIGEKLGDPYMKASAYANMSTIYNAKGDEKQELEYLLKSIEVSRENGLDETLANSLFNLSVYFASKMEFERSEDLLDELKVLYHRMNNLYGFALMHNVRAKLAFDQNDPEQALIYLDSSLQYFEQLGYMGRVASLHNNIGQVKAEMGNYDEARKSIWKAYTTFLEIGELRSAAICIHDLGLIFHAKEMPNAAISYIQRAIFICHSLGVLDLQAEYTKDLSEIYSKAGMQDSAYKALISYNSLKDTLNKINNKELIQLMETEFESERKEMEIESLKKEKELQKATLESQKAQNQLLYVGLGAALILIHIISYAFIQKKRDNLLISSQKELLLEKNEQLNEQKEIVEEKNREITDSINYAKKIQEAVLPPAELIEAKLPKSFILYLPKDIVAGDFYWFHSLNKKALIAAADCTGHGVPGAMVSVVCSNALNRATAEFDLTKPGDILNKCQELVSADLGNSETIKDGMDVALAAIDGSNSIEYAGANNPLWIIGEKPKTTSELIEFKIEGVEQSLYEVKADKQAVGKVEDPKPFNNHRIELKIFFLMVI